MFHGILQKQAMVLVLVWVVFPLGKSIKFKSTLYPISLVFIGSTLLHTPFGEGTSLMHGTSTQITGTVTGYLTKVPRLKAVVNDCWGEEK